MNDQNNYSNSCLMEIVMTVFFVVVFIWATVETINAINFVLLKLG